MNFPLLENKQIAYLDSAASSQKLGSVMDAMRDFDMQTYANVHRGVYDLAEKATEKYELARENVANFINAQPEEVIFTSGTTASLNMVARMLVRDCKPGDEIVLTIMEHHSNFVPWQQLAKQYDLVLKVITLTPDFKLDMQVAKEMISEKTKIVTFVHVSNTLGTIVPVQELTKLAHEHDAIVVVDGAQAVSHMKVDMKALDIDYYAFSGHKMYGPTGIGVLYGKKELLLKQTPVVWGGEMVKDVKIEDTSWNDIPWKFEPGTPGITQAIGLSVAIDFLRKNMQDIQENEHELITYAVKQLETVEGVSIIGPKTNRGGAISFTMEGLHPHDIATILDEKGVAVRAGHHCTQPLHCSLGIDATTRVSIGAHNTKEDIDRLISGLKKAKEVFK